MKRLSLCLLLSIACVDDSAIESDVLPVSSVVGDSTCFDLPKSVGAKQLCVVVNEEWRLNQDSAVRQKRTVDGNDRLLETGAVLFDPAEPRLMTARSYIWPYPSCGLSPVGSLPDTDIQPVTAGIVGFEQITPYSLMLHYRRAAACIPVRRTPR